MNKLGFSLIALALVLNLLVASMGGLHGTDNQPTGDLTDETPDEIVYVASNVTSVSVPALSIYDIASYDNRIYAAQYWENTSSGEWGKIEIIALGQTTERIGAVENAKDGFFQPHECVAKESITTGSIELIYTNSSEGHLSLTGELDMDRTEYWDIDAMRPVAVSNGGGIVISGLGALLGDDLGDVGNIGDLSFSGDVRSWPDLRTEHVLSLEDRLFGSGEELTMGDSGTIYQANTDNGYDMPYDWEIQQGLVISGEETVLINITSTFWDFLPYTKHIWVSSNISMPARVWDYTNISWGYEGSTFYDEEEESEDAGYIVIENERILKDDGWSQGADSVPWDGTLGDQTPSGYFLQRNPYGEFKPWYDNMMPVGGDNFASGSYNFQPEELVEFVSNTSTGFQNFTQTYDDVTIAYGGTNATFYNRDDTEGEFWWNVNFRHKPTEAESEAAWEDYEASGYEDFDAPWTYWMQVKKTVTNTGTIRDPVYTTTYEIFNESIRDSWSSGANNKYAYPDDVLTLSGFENIIRIDSETSRTCFEDGKLKWNYELAIPLPEDDDYTETSIDVSGEEDADGFMDMITMITGLSLPTYDFAWSHARGWTGNDGYQYIVSVDAETGQFLGAISVEGTQFMALFM